ncbi:fungal-specific transcription factor domain-containing protein [Xylariaceae sp. AK1471]|nr:fungal-specific transcription factor domain-containing protein [Xylariaceae sp. AK1471]
MGRQRNRTFTGCWRCRKRKVKCDESKPECQACTRIGARCTGYGPKYIWVENEDRVPRSDGRRALVCEKTWAGFEVPSFDLVDILILQCDDIDSTDLQYRQPICYNPFSVFPAMTASRTSPAPVTPPPRIPIHLTEFPDQAHGEKALFHHYVTHVATIMMPYEHPRNPWKFHYPTIALSQDSSGSNGLYCAMLAQAAFNLSSLRGGNREMMSLGFEHYGSAVQRVLHDVQGEIRDFGLAICSIMTTMFSEVYAGISQRWRQHLEGAWKLLQEFRIHAPWNMASYICISLQSLVITRIIGQTSKLEYMARESTEDDDIMVLDPIATTPGFGFTIGAPVTILQCISRIDKFRNQRRHGTPDTDINDILQDIISRLRQCQEDSLSTIMDLSDPLDAQSNEAHNTSSGLNSTYYQVQAFISATYIYLYRTLLNAPPTSVKLYVGRTLEQYSQFSIFGAGNFSLWPPFIAAVEAYTDEDLQVARIWLESMVSCGIGSRMLVKKVVEEVWQRREARSKASGLDLGMISIDWRKVMQELDCDVLLI